MDALRIEQLAQLPGVCAESAAEFFGIRAGLRGDLDLPTRFEADEAAVSERQSERGGVDGGRGVGPEGGGEGGEGGAVGLATVGVGAVGEPFQFGADEFRWAHLETHPAEIGLRRGARGQRRGARGRSS